MLNPKPIRDNMDNSLKKNKKHIRFRCLSLLFTPILFSGCSIIGFGGSSTKVIPHKFDGFMIYDKPNKIPVKVYKNCYINDTQTECIKIDDFKKAIIRTRKLERIIDNYEQDIKDYKELKY